MLKSTFYLLIASLIVLVSCQTYRVPPQDSDIRITKDNQRIQDCQRLGEVRSEGLNALMVLDEIKFQTWEKKGDTLLINLEHNGLASSNLANILF